MPNDDDMMKKLLPLIDLDALGALPIETLDGLTFLVKTYGDRIRELENTIHDMHTIRRDTLEEVLKICAQRFEQWTCVYNTEVYRDNEHVRGLMDEAEAMVDIIRALKEKE